MLDGDSSEAKPLQPFRKKLKLRQLFDYPTVAQLAVNVPLHSADELVSHKKSVSDHKVSASP
jgi:hypothetical protein